MGDDGVGTVVARMLATLPLGERARVVEGSLAGMGLIRHFLGSDRVIVVDALDAGAEAGDIFRFHPDEAGVTQLRSNNIHGMGVGYLLTNSRLLGHDPDVVVFGVQVGDVRPSEALTPPVRAAARRVAEMIAEELRVPAA